MVGRLTFPGRILGVDLSDDYAYVADVEYGLRVISIADLSHPVEVGSYDTDGQGSDVRVVGTYAYLADGRGGLKIFSIADPTDPMLVGAFEDGGHVSSVTLQGHYAYLSDYDDSMLKIVSVLDPSTPAEVSHYNIFDGICQSVFLKDDYAYLAADFGSGQGGIYVLCVRDPTLPSYVSFLWTRSTAWEIAIRDTFAYVADEYADLAIISIADPLELREVAYWDSMYIGSGVAVALSGENVYLASSYGGLQIVSVEDPARPQQVGYYDTIDAGDVAVSGSYAYVADYYGGFLILEYYGPTGIGDSPDLDHLPRTFSLFQNYPNPFNPSTTIEVAIPEDHAGTATLAIHDVRGRLVNMLFQGTLLAGRRAFVWDGTDNRGLRVPAGVYLCTLKNGAWRMTKKMVLLE
jgi:hypothetical protein